MPDEPLRDTSEFDAPLTRLQQLHDHLECELHGFICRTTRELTGDRKRDSLRHYLYEMDVELRLIEKLRSDHLPLLKRHVTTTMKKSILHQKEDVVALRSMLLPLTHCLGKEARSVRYRLKRLHDRLDDLVDEVLCHPDDAELSEAIKDACWDLEMGDESAFEPIIKRLTASK